jgi:uncharacterized protein (DUF4415 family)
MSKQLSGITGVLSNYVSKEPSQGNAARADPAAPTPKANPRPADQKTKARLGRPPGKRTRTSGHKEKATLRLDAELMNDYREWSWELRCQLGELIERALADYRRRHRKAV